MTGGDSKNFNDVIMRGGGGEKSQILDDVV